MDRRLVETFLGEISKLGQFGADIDDLYAAPNSSVTPTLKRVHNLGKSSSWTSIGPVGQREGRSAPFQRVPWDKEKQSEFYHGSPRKLKTLKTRDEHGDPRVPLAVFASPSENFALAYAGRKWGDRDISQWTRGGAKADKMILREARPGAFKDIYGRKKGYLYEVPEKPFKAIPGRRTMKEVISTESVRPTKTRVIPNVLKALREMPGVEMHEYDPNAPENRADIKRQVSRMREMKGGDAKQYLKWRLEVAPPETKRIFKEEMAKQSALYHYGPKDVDLAREGLKTPATLKDPRVLDKYRRLAAEAGKSPDKLTRADILSALEKRRGPGGLRMVSLLKRPIGPQDDEGQRAFAARRRLYEVDYDRARKEGIVEGAHIVEESPRSQRAVSPGRLVGELERAKGFKRTDPVLLFQGTPHAFVTAKGGTIPGRYLKEKRGSVPNQVFEAGDNKYDVQKLWKASKGLPRKRLDLDDSEDFMESRSWTGGRTPNEVLADRDDSHGHFTRIRKANLRYPVILAPNGGVVDGMHRLAKARSQGKDTVPMRKFESWSDMRPALMEKRGFDQILMDADLEELREKTAAKPAGIKIMYVGKEFGSGHISQARNIEAAAKKRGIDTEMIDFNRKFGKPGSRQRYEKAFRQNLKKPSLLGAAKVLGNHLRHHFTGIDKDKLQKFTEANRDHAIVVTNPHLRSSMGGVKQPVHVLHTDPEAWAGEVAINPRRNKQIHLGTKDAVRSLIGWDEKKALTGLPIHPDHLKRGERTGLMQKGRLNVTVSGGGLGLDVAEMTKNVLKGLPEKATVHAVAGGNRRALRTLKSLAKKDPRVQPHGFAPLGRMMHEADLNVLRAHGTSFQESVAAGKPSIYYAPDARMGNMQGKLTKNTALYGERTMKQPAAIGMERLPEVTADAVARRGELRRIARKNRKELGNPADEAVRFIMKDRPEYEKAASLAKEAFDPADAQRVLRLAKKKMVKVPRLKRAYQRAVQRLERGESPGLTFSESVLLRGSGTPGAVHPHAAKELQRMAESGTMAGHFVSPAMISGAKQVQGRILAARGGDTTRRILEHPLIGQAAAGPIRQMTPLQRKMHNAVVQRHEMAELAAKSLGGKPVPAFNVGTGHMGTMPPLTDHSLLATLPKGYGPVREAARTYRVPEAYLLERATRGVGGRPGITFGAPGTRLSRHARKRVGKRMEELAEGDLRANLADPEIGPALTAQLKATGVNEIAGIGKIGTVLPPYRQPQRAAPTPPQKQEGGITHFIRNAGPGIGGAIGLGAGALLGARRGQLLRGALAGLGTGATLGWVPGMGYGVAEGVRGLR